MTPHICGEAEDLLGRRIPQEAFRINTATGETWQWVRDPKGGWLLNDAGAVVVKKQQFIPPITIWLYT